MLKFVFHNECILLNSVFPRGNFFTGTGIGFFVSQTNEGSGKFTEKRVRVFVSQTKRADFSSVEMRHQVGGRLGAAIGVVALKISRLRLLHGG